jgi:acyl-CoA synthetase (NDP forming)/GNAT superfamily N-acetyltransferase
MRSAPGGGGARVVLADGRIARLRQLCPEDQAAVLNLHQKLEQRDQYFRFFGPLPPRAADLVRGMTAPANAGHGSVGVFVAGVPLGVANYEVLTDPIVAEVALAVSGDAQAHGVGTLLLEHLVSLARRRGVRRFVAEVLTENARMLRVFRASGLGCRLRHEGSVTHLDIVLDASDSYLDAVAEWERVAAAVNLRAVLRPSSLVVVGGGPEPGSDARAVLGNLIAGGYTGRLFAVDPSAGEGPEAVVGVTTVPTVAALPVACELAVLCVPADAVAEVAGRCGQRGVRALVVVSPGPDGEPGRDDLFEVVRRYGMRMVGPGSLGVTNSDPAIRLDATLARLPQPAGSIGLVTQAGRGGLALRDRLSELGLGLSTMVSTGDKRDVSGNDLLMWWSHDDATSAVALCLESFGNPRKFSRLCQALARRKPLLAVRNGGQAGGPSAPDLLISTVRRDALFRQAGVVVVDTATELVSTLAALSWQPLPPGNRVAVITNAGVAGMLDPGGYARAGLLAAELGESTVATLGALPEGPPLADPVRTAATVDAGTFARCLAAVLADDGVDAVIAVTVRTAIGDPIGGLAGLGRGVKPVLAVRLGQAEAITALRDAGGAPRTACYASPVEAVGVVGRLAAYARWRCRPETLPAPPTDVDLPRAVAVVGEHLRLSPAGGWLGPSARVELLRCFGIPVLETRFASAVGASCPESGASAEPVVRPNGREPRISMHADDVFGPLVELGLGGTDTDPVTDRNARLTPLTGADADELLRGLRASSALFGSQATPALDHAAVRDVLLRVGLLAQLLPEVAELHLHPLVVTSRGCQVLEARIQVVVPGASDPFLPGLRG